MTYISFSFFVFVLISVFLYYIPTLFFRYHSGVIQWVVLLISSIIFYYRLCSIKQFILLSGTIFVSYGGGVLLLKLRDKKQLVKVILAVVIAFVCSPLLFVKFVSLCEINQKFVHSLIIPIGLSFYTLQIIAYLIDCYKGKCQPEKNILKYMLFVSFFPHIIQGPIPRFSTLGKQLTSPHKYEFKQIISGIQLILWGFFLKLMIADKAAIAANQVFNNYERYVGLYIVIAGFFYSIQLYTDFYACTTICQGVAQLYGIKLADNFRRPYFATSIADFWRRWHISLSSWLRDYIYIPLGGSRKGNYRTYLHLIFVFFVSGLWHGNGLNFIVWGLLHGIYLVVGRLTATGRQKIYAQLGVADDSICYKLIKRTGVFILVMFAWIIFRAENLTVALNMLRSIFYDFNPWVLFGTSRFSFGLDIHETIILFASIVVLLIISSLQEHNIEIRNVFSRQSILVRWIIYLLVIWSIWIFGTYGYGYNAADFIYGRF